MFSNEHFTLSLRTSQFVKSLLIMSITAMLTPGDQISNLYKKLSFENQMFCSSFPPHLLHWEQCLIYLSVLPRLQIKALVNELME